MKCTSKSETWIVFASSKKKRFSSGLSNYVVSTSAAEKDEIVEQWARFFYKNRIPFRVAEDNEFKKSLKLMRPGISENLLSEKDLAGKYLMKTHDEIEREMQTCLQVIYYKTIVHSFR